MLKRYGIVWLFLVTAPTLVPVPVLVPVAALSAVKDIASYNNIILIYFNNRMMWLMYIISVQAAANI